MDNSKQSIIDHLEELRFRIIWSLLAVIVTFVPSCFLAPPAIDLLIKYTCPEGTQLNYIRPMELFFNQLEVALLFAVMLALPIISYQLWRFVAPALYQHEKKLIVHLSGASCALFLLGVAFALLFVFPAIMRFSLGMKTEQIKPELVIDSFISLAVSLSLGFGVMFQLPIVVCVLVSLGVVKLETMHKARPIVVSVIFVLAAILTPPDVISQLTLGIPTWLLFEASLLFCKKLDRKRQAREEQQRLQEEQEDRQQELERQQHLNASREKQADTQNDSSDTQDDYLPDEPEYPDPADENAPYYDYGYTSPTSVTRVRNITPGKHLGRRSRRSQR